MCGGANRGPKLGPGELTNYTAWAYAAGWLGGLLGGGGGHFDAPSLEAALGGSAEGFVAQVGAFGGAVFAP